FGLCNGVRAESYRTNFADGPATVADLDRDGTPEVVATGRTYDCTGGETTKYTGVYVFAADRGRFVTPPYDWTIVPIDLGAPLSLDFDVIESASYNPAVADLDGDGAPEVIASAYSIVVLDGATGALEWRVASGHDRSEPGAESEGRTWPGIAVADVDNDGALEIVTAHGGGWAAVYRADGFFEPGWPRQPVANELRGLAVGDLDRDGTFEIVVSAARGNAVNTWVLEHTGATRPGWPQLAGGGGFAWGVYNDNVALANLDADAALEIVVPSDVHYICSYEANGAHRVADAVFGGDNWGEVGTWESYATELVGFGLCNGVRAESYRTNFADGPATVADLDRDGTPEV
ncbi:MAG: VCBS repeat-containing protein, partial [Chloroflexi bacterium]|nr:VCBS repeat-containing protein [Chloroflexota bacterium]